MTHHTDAERAEFEDWARNDFYAGLASVGDTWNSERGMYSDAAHHMAFHAWQAARRAPAAPVPQGWKLVPDDANMTDEQAEAICAVAKVCGGGAYDIYRAALAAAPQPPEAAPVQLPEPDAWRYTDARGHYRYRGARPGFAVEYPILKPEALYTEQQVRELLAAHDIQERST